MNGKFFLYALCVLLVSTFASWSSMFGAASSPGRGSSWSSHGGSGGNYGGSYGGGYSGHGGGGHK